jgi:hypothetical protein
MRKQETGNRKQEAEQEAEGSGTLFSLLFPASCFLLPGSL